jgi:hypothetical protein
MIRRTKAKLKALLNQPQSNLPTDQERLIAQVVDDQVLALPQSRIKITRSREEITDNGLLPEAPFADFLGQYHRLQAAGGANNEALVRQQQAHPFISDFAQLAISYLNQCDSLPPTMAPLMRRHFYRLISILNSKESARVFDYKRDLPKVGLCYFPNPGPRQFVIDALIGMANIIDMDPGKMVELVWSIKQYNFDYALYQKTLSERIESEVNQFPADFISRCPSKEWLVKELSAGVQYQWALVELLKLRYFDVIFLGAAEVPLAMALYDLPKDLLPPIVALCHGIPAGDPVMSFFARMDHVLVRCEPEKQFYADLGVPPERIVEIGSTSAEDFPSQVALSHARLNARYALGLSDDDTVILYATTYDIAIYNTKSCAETLDLIVTSLAQCVEQHGLKNPVFYIKYHPSPASDPTFSYSRSQYPLSAFSQLIELGYRIRLADSLEAVLPACDCFIAHESTTMADALDRGIPTISIKMQKGDSKLFLGSRAYTEVDCHKNLSVYDSPAQLALYLHQLCTLEKVLVYKQSKHLWQALFGSGRTVGLIKVAQLVTNLIAKS